MKILREPLLHFLVIGAMLFGAFDLINSDDTSAPDEIIVSAGQIGSMRAVFARTWQRPPTEAEMEALVKDHIRDEVFYREGVAMGLNQDDAVIRRRVRQKLEFVNDLAVVAQPSDAELKAFVAEQPQRFLSETRQSFAHVYFPADFVPPPAELERLRQALNSGTLDVSQAGKPFMAGADFNDFTISAIKQTFGDEFAGAIDRFPLDQWAGPVTSAYGTHLLRVTKREDARDRPFEEVREVARREWLHSRKAAANDALYAKLKSRYVINIETGPQKLAETAP